MILTGRGMRRFLVSLLILGALSSCARSQSVSHRLQVGSVKDKTLIDGCGCYFRFRGLPESSERYIFFSSIEDDDKTAWMNVDGKDIKLKLVKTSESKRRERVGTRSSMTYAAGDLTVSITLVATRVCKPNDENCESTDYKAMFTLKRGTERRVLRAIGWCGC